MKVKEVMTPDPQAIWITGSLADAAKSMWENDCGILPIIKDGRKVVGVVTDRDICMATAMKDRSPSGMSVEEVMSGELYTVTPEDDIRQALQTMQEHQIRRVPVVSAENELEGILSMNDIVLKAKEANGETASIDFAQVVKTCQAIGQHLLPMTTAATAAK